MPRLAANLTFLFNEVPFLDRFAAAADEGFTAVECLFPYEYDPGDLRQRLDAHDLTLALHNLPAGRWDAGERGIACLPERVAEFERGVDTCVRYAQRLGCHTVNCLAGIPPQTVAPARARDTFVRNLRVAADRLHDAGIRLVIEPINTKDMPGFFLTTSRQACEILDEVGSTNLFVQYDLYHMHIMEGDVTTALRRLGDRVGHIQIADPPGRHEPGTGELDYTSAFAAIDALGYTGWVGCEYKPHGRTRDGLDWARPYLRG